MSRAPRSILSTENGIIVVTASLLSFGLVMNASAGASLDHNLIQLRIWETAFGRQALFAIAGFVAMLAASRGAHRLGRWREGAWLQPSVLFFLFAIACLATVLVPGIGTMRNGALRWLQVGPPAWGLGFQPSELAKLALVVLLAAWMAGRAREVHNFWRDFVPPSMAIGIVVILVGIEDFGTALFLAAVGAALLIAGGTRLRYLCLVALPAALTMTYLVICEPYRVRRLTAFLDIWSDPRGAGYHPIQSLVTIASGGITGRGLGLSVQKFGYLPEARSDFIFSVICEETGMIGGLFVIGLFLVLLWLGGRIVNAPAIGAFDRLLAFGVTFMIVLQAALNVAVVTVCAPTKGISLPFVSAGGSGVLLLCFAMGLLVAIAREVECAQGGETEAPASVVIAECA